MVEGFSAGVERDGEGMQELGYGKFTHSFIM